MNQKTVKTGMILISYIAILFLLVVYFKEILSGINTFLGYATPFIIGLVLAFFLNPPYRFFMRLFKKIKVPETLSRLFSTILVLLLAYGLITGIVMIVIPQVTSNFKNFFNNFDQYLNSLQNTLNNITEKFDIENFDLNLVIEFIKNTGIKIQNSITEWGPQAFTYTKKVISGITGILIGIIFSIYILNARDRILRQIHRLSSAVFNEKTFKVLHHIGKVMLKTFDNYVVGQSIEAMILGSLCYIGMLSFNFAYPGLISVVVAITALVPIVGTIVGGAIGFFLYLLVDPVRAIIFLIFFTVLQQLENNLIYPKVVGSKIGLPGLWVLFAVMIGSQVGGLIGMLFGVPIFTVIYTLLKDLTLYKEKEKAKKLQNESFSEKAETVSDESPTIQESVPAPFSPETPTVEDRKENEKEFLAEETQVPLFYPEKKISENKENTIKATTDIEENPNNTRIADNKPANASTKKRMTKAPSGPGRERPPFFFSKNKKL